MDFALIVENYITKQRNVVSKPKNFTAFNISEQLKDKSDATSNDVLKNGAVVKIILEPYVSNNLKPDTEIKQTEDLKLKLK